MRLQSWMISTVQAMNRLFVRSDLPPYPGSTGRMPAALQLGDGRFGPYAPLVGVVRQALQAFVVGELGLHLAIAEADRYRLTAIEIQCLTAGDFLPHRFQREFRPEQIKRFLIRELLAGLPNAGAIDLSRFGGICPAATTIAGNENDTYGELLRELNGPEQLGEPAYQVRLLGHWLGATPASALAIGEFTDGRAWAAAPSDVSTVEIEIEDAKGSRTLALPLAALPRRYSVGQDASCDIVVGGRSASRRHCEIWFHDDAWWVADSGSTHGLRIELASGTPVCAGTRYASRRVVKFPAGARLVLSAFADGQAADYPCLRISNGVPAAGRRRLPSVVLPPTPLTAIEGIKPTRRRLTLTARMASGIRSLELGPGQLPFGLGRSHQQALVIDGAHVGVSRRHAEIIDLSDAAAEVRVLGDNGVVVGNSAYAPGARFCWRVGESMLLGRGAPKEPPCILTLSAAQQ